MRHEPVEMPPGLLAGLLREHWEIDAGQVRYAPLGAGSHHWFVQGDSGRWFVTADQLSQSVHYADPAGRPEPEYPEPARPAGRPEPGQGGDPEAAARDAAFAGLDAALRTAVSLRDGGCEFVLAPVPDRLGAPVRRVRPDWAVAVYPYLDGGPAGTGDWPDPRDRARVAELVARVHESPPAEEIPRWTHTIEARPALLAALRDTAEPWRSGPYAEPLRPLLARSAAGIEALLAAYDELVPRALDDSDAWVVTHGEAHSRNVMRLEDDRLLLIDWDTVAFAPRERDLEAVIRDEDDPAWHAYQAVAGARELRGDRITLFRLLWDLTDIALYVRDLRTPHTGTADDRRAFDVLSAVYLPVERRWPGVWAGDLRRSVVPTVP